MKKKKKPVTLIEIMIVIVLIGIIGTALAVNMKGSLNKGKEFKTSQNIGRVKNALDLLVAEGKDPQEVLKDWKNLVTTSPLGGEGVIVDARNKELIVTLEKNGTFKVTAAP